MWNNCLYKGMELQNQSRHVDVVRCELQVGVARNECRSSWGHFLEGFISQAGELEDPWIHVN